MKTKETKCFYCKLPYGGDSWIEAIIPDKIWIEISPYNNQGGILCISCMAERLKKLGYDNVPVWICGTEPFKVQVGDPNDNIELLRNYNNKS